MKLSLVLIIYRSQSSIAEEASIFCENALNEKDIRGQRQEIKERDETIGEKEKRIFELKRKNQELEKFKFVLDYKIKELKKQIEPKMETATHPHLQD